MIGLYYRQDKDFLPLHSNVLIIDEIALRSSLIEFTFMRDAKLSGTSHFVWMT